ncbi:hypothetical protein ABBQ38_011560 [Trebouxia sp. C0009 RCD-2024]
MSVDTSDESLPDWVAEHASPWLQSQAPQQTDSSPDSDKIGISEKAVRMRNNLDLRIKSGVLTSLF